MPQKESQQKRVEERKLDELITNKMHKLNSEMEIQNCEGYDNLPKADEGGYLNAVVSFEQNVLPSENYCSFTFDEKSVRKSKYSKGSVHTDDRSEEANCGSNALHGGVNKTGYREKGENVRVSEKKKDTQSGLPVELNLKKKKEECSDRLNNTNVTTNLNVKSGREEENSNKHFISPKVNNELSIPDLRKKNKEIITKFENYSITSRKQNNFPHKEKNKNTNFAYKKWKYIDESKKSISEDIKIEKYFIQQSDTDFKVQRKVDSIEHVLGEAERKEASIAMQKTNSLKRGSPNGGGKVGVRDPLRRAHREDVQSEDVQNEDVHNGDLRNEDLHNEDLHNEDLHKEDLRNEDLRNRSANSGLFSSDFSSQSSCLSDTEGQVCKNVKVFGQDTERMGNKWGLTLTDKGGTEKEDISVSQHRNIVQSIKRKESKVSSANSSEGLENIKIYDDSEIDEVKESELESFWLNKEMSSILSRNRFDSDKFSDEFSEDKIIWKKEDSNILRTITSRQWTPKRGGGNKKQSDKNIELKIKKCQSDIINCGKMANNSFVRRNSFSHVVMGKNTFREEEDTSTRYSTQKNKGKKENIDMASRMEMVKEKLSRSNNNIDIDSMNYEGFDMYKVDFERLGLNVDCLEKEEKYILMLYISEKKLELVSKEREAFKREYNNTRIFGLNEKNKKNLSDNNYNPTSSSEYGYIMEDETNCKKSNTLTGKQHFEMDNMRRKKVILMEEGNHIFNASIENANIKESPTFGMSSSPYVLRSKPNGERNSFSILNSDTPFVLTGKKQLEKNLLRSSNDNDKLPQKGLFFEFYRSLLTQHQVENEHSNSYVNEKALLEKILKCFIYTFLRDESVNPFLDNCEDINKINRREETYFRNRSCSELMCNQFFLNAFGKEERMGDDQTNINSEMVKRMVSKCMLNDNLVNKMKEMRMINQLLNEEVRTYSIKVACMDMYIDVEAHFIEDAERVVVGKDVGLFYIQTVNGNYKYNYYINEKEGNVGNRNDESVWDYLYGYFSDIYSWYSDGVQSGGETPLKKLSLEKTSSQDDEGSSSKDFSSSKRLSRNYIKRKEQNRRTSRTGLQSYEEQGKMFQGDNSPGERQPSRDKDTYPLPVEENEETGKSREKNFKEVDRELFNVSNNKFITGKIEDETILSNSTKIGDGPMGSNLSSVDNSVLDGSNRVRTRNSNDLENHTWSNSMEKRMNGDASDGGSNTRVKSYMGDYSVQEINLLNEDNTGNVVIHNNGERGINSLLSSSQCSCAGIGDKLDNDVEAQLVSFQYRGCLTKEEMNTRINMHKSEKDSHNAFEKTCKKSHERTGGNKNAVGSYFAMHDSQGLVAIHIRDDMIENAIQAHFVMEKCKKYNSKMNNSYVHILSAKTKQYLAVNLENGKFVFTKKYDDLVYTDHISSKKHKVCTYFKLQPISDMMKNTLVDDIVHAVADVMMN
ncbi:conserved Plasmodium protein, unknown function [Plasmodium ovale]|uniref:Uncharacterized protein n=1 Tax=Plasmodium ovale TaxID=36330 RepID=A0A1D3U9Q2_PLAOA|nr:conserved Plasmodium protein, unknown function [Plasmodium ovale]